MNHRKTRPLRSVAGLVLAALFVRAALCEPLTAEDRPAREWPDDAGLLNVKDFGAKGDGETDDTAALQAALDKWPGGKTIVYLPPGTYVISDTLRWPDYRRGWEYKHVILMGAGPDRSTIKLQDRCSGYGDARKPKAMIWTGPKPAQRFHNGVEQLTIDSGRGNPGAIGLQFHANNTGKVMSVRIRSGDPSGAGVFGLDMRFTSEIGPLLVKDLEVIGFDVGIRTGGGINSQTFEHVRLSGQREVGWLNTGQVISVRDLQSDNAVQALKSEGGTVTVLDTVLTGRGPASEVPAITNQLGKVDGKMLLRNVRTEGYADALVQHKAHGKRGEVLPGPDVREWVSHGPVTLFDTPGRTLGLPVEETPVVPWHPAAQWANVQDFGATVSNDPDDAEDTEAFRRAFASGKKSIYLANNGVAKYPQGRGNYVITEPLEVPGTVERIIGCEASVCGDPYWVPVDLHIKEDGPPLVIERVHGFRIHNSSPRTVIIRHLVIKNGYFGEGKGKVFFEDVCGAPIRVKGQQMWARQLNPELWRPEVKKEYVANLHNDGGTVWVLGLKTEGGGTLVQSINGGRTEILGAHCYSTHMKQEDHYKQPMLVVEKASLSFFGSECQFSGPTYKHYAKQTNDGTTRMHGAGGLPDNYGSGKTIPLFVARPERP